MLFQFILNGFITGLLYALLAMAFSLTYNTTRVFSIAYAGVVVSACFIHYWLIKMLGLPFWAAVPLTLLIAGLLNTLSEKCIYQPLEKRGSTHNSILVASIGLFIILTNLLAMLFGNENKTFSQSIYNSLKFGNIIITRMQLIQLVVSGLLAAGVLMALRKTNLGLKINALSHDRLLFEVFGHNALRLRLVLYFISGVLGAAVSLLIGYDVGFDPYFGMGLLLNALVVMILGGFGSFKGALIGGLILGILQSLSVYFFEARWETAITFLLLVLILIFRPQGIFGVKQRWI